MNYLALDAAAEPERQDLNAGSLSPEPTGGSMTV